MNYRKKTDVIQAMQFRRDANATVATWPCEAVHRWMRSHGADGIGWTRVTGEDGEAVYRPCISTAEGLAMISDGDWVLRSVAGEFSVCKPGLFAQTYEAAE